MCIIVAKPTGIQMPTIHTLEKCFDNNPDGAGIMLASKGKVWGFKGLMAFKDFTDKLRVLENRFGNLDKLAVVMHFRIGTHGSNVPANTHPFPLKGSYEELRALEWVDEQGMAHNGIISALSYHKDIEAENVSDTMVFVKRVIAPIANTMRVTKNTDVVEGLGLMSRSKLAFLDGKGLIQIAGDFTLDEGVLYSNTTYKNSYARHNHYYDYEYGGYYKSYYANRGYESQGSLTLLKTQEEEEDTLKIPPRLPKEEMNYLMESLVDDMGLISAEGVTIKAFGREKTLSQYHAFDPSDGSLYCFDETYYNWYELYLADEYTILIDEKEDTLNEDVPTPR